MDRWISDSIAKINADAHRSADTHLFKLPVRGLKGVDIYLKDESTHPTGSLKHRLARSLFLYALVNGKIREGTRVIEASSGSTAVSEAYFARMIGVPFTAVLPKSTAKSKIDLIRFQGGEIHFVDAAPDMHKASVELAAEVGGYFMDQFKYAERATDWRGNNNIAESLFRQMEQESHPIPSVIVMSAGTGGTSATLGRYIRYKGFNSELIVVDPENSVFFDSFRTGDRTLTRPCSSRIEGIGRPRVEKSFLADVIDRMIQVPDAASIATMLWLEDRIRRRAGPSTGTNLWGALQIAQEMEAAGRSGSIVTILCDDGNRYLDTYYDPEWVMENFGETASYEANLAAYH